MTVFKTFWKIIKKYKGTIILYTVLLIVFGGINMTTNDNQTIFVDSKPDILIINKDEEIGLTKNLVDYLKNNSNIIDIKEDEESINDALFYREVNYIIYIPQNYREDVLKGLNPEIDIKSTGDYQASLAEMLLSKYIKIQNIYSNMIHDENELIEAINELEFSDDCFIEIILVGKRNFEINIYNLYKYELNEKIIKIKDKTKPNYNIEEISKENTLKGLFAKEILEEIKKGQYNEEIIEKALEIGMEILE